MTFVPPFQNTAIVIGPETNGNVGMDSSHHQRYFIVTNL